MSIPSFQPGFQPGYQAINAPSVTVGGKLRHGRPFIHPDREWQRPPTLELVQPWMFEAEDLWLLGIIDDTQFATMETP